jgi:hypothetical protein
MGEKLTAKERSVLTGFKLTVLAHPAQIRDGHLRAFGQLLARGLIEPKTGYQISPAGLAALSEKGRE